MHRVREREQVTSVGGETHCRGITQNSVRGPAAAMERPPAGSVPLAARSLNVAEVCAESCRLQGVTRQSTADHQCALAALVSGRKDSNASTNTLLHCAVSPGPRSLLHIKALGEKQTLHKVGEATPGPKRTRVANKGSRHRLRRLGAAP